MIHNGGKTASSFNYKNKNENKQTSWVVHILATLFCFQRLKNISHSSCWVGQKSFDIGLKLNRRLPSRSATREMRRKAKSICLFSFSGFYNCKKVHYHFHSKNVSLCSHLFCQVNLSLQKEEWKLLPFLNQKDRDNLKTRDLSFSICLHHKHFMSQNKQGTHWKAILNLSTIPPMQLWHLLIFYLSQKTNECCYFGKQIQELLFPILLRVACWLVPHMFADWWLSKYGKGPTKLQMWPLFCQKETSEIVFPFFPRHLVKWTPDPLPNLNPVTPDWREVYPTSEVGKQFFIRLNFRKKFVALQKTTGCASFHLAHAKWGWHMCFTSFPSNSPCGRLERNMGVCRSFMA